MHIIDYNSKDHSFLFVDQDYNLISCPYIFPDKDVGGNVHDINKNNNFLIKIVHKKNIPENEILKVYIKDESNRDKRIGWIIPFSSLISLEHDFKDDIHFGYYAFYCYVYALHQTTIQNCLKEGKDISEAINSIYIENSDSAIFIAEKRNIPDLNNLDCFEASLYRHGYYINYYRLNSNCLTTHNKRIHLKKISKTFFDEGYKEEYIKSFFHVFYFEENPKIRFFMLYQLIEIIIDDIMVNQLQKQLADYKIGKAATRGLDTLIKTNTELDRIKKMILLSKSNGAIYIDLHETCNNYLISKGHDSVKFPESIYHFRNMIVHRFRWIITEETIIDKVNDLMELFLFDILIGYENN